MATPTMLVECLVSDFQGSRESVAGLATCGLDVYAHNIETVERLQPFVRDKRANYQQSLTALRAAKAARAEEKEREEAEKAARAEERAVAKAARDAENIRVPSFLLQDLTRLAACALVATFLWRI